MAPPIDYSQIKLCPCREGGCAVAGCGVRIHYAADVCEDCAHGVHEGADDEVNDDDSFTDAIYEAELAAGYDYKDYGDHD